MHRDGDAPIDIARLRRSVNGARTFSVPTEVMPRILAEVDRAMHDARFRSRPIDAASGALRVYRRGSLIGDVLIGGSGLSMVTRRIGPLSALGVVVVWAGERTPDTSCVIVSLVSGSHVGADFVAAVEAAVHVLSTAGIPLADEGWSRAVDVDPMLPANPRRAAALGLR